MNERELYGDKPWLEHYDINPEGENVTVEHVEKRLDGKQPLLHFYEKTKPLTLFWHVYRDIKRILGEDDTDNWENRCIKLVPTIIKINGGDEKETIKIEAADPVEKKPEPKKLPTLKRRALPSEMRSSIDSDNEKRAALAAAKAGNSKNETPFDP
jgi:hypothetical protein